MTHTKKCQQAQEARKRAQDRWRAKWPNHCPRCLGRTNCENPCAGTHSHDPRELRPLAEGERGCLFQLWCPRCGQPDAMHPEDPNVPCQFCGWQEVYPEVPETAQFGCPVDYECCCRVHKAEEQQAARSRLLREKEQAEQRLRKTVDMLRKLGA